jgi:glycosyltransferase involved in cell wall biosynthesis
MRLALLTDGVFPHVVGGIQKHSAHLAGYLARAGVEVELHHLPGDDREAAAALAGFAEADRERIDSHLSVWPSPLRLPGHYLRACRAHSAALFENLRPGLGRLDAIYAQGLTGLACTAARRRGELTVPVAVNPHGLEPFQRSGTWKEALRARLLSGIVRESLVDADLAISLGGGLTDILTGLGIPREKIAEVPNGVESDWFVDEPRQREGALRFVFLGRYERRKGVEELGQVLPALLARHELQFDFIGPVPESLQLGSPHVRYHGLVRDPARVRELLRSADVLVCPSWSEGMPTVILEAMASGLAIIATDVGAVRELVDESNGRLLPAGDAAALSSALEELLGLPEERLQELKRASLERVSGGYTWEAVAAGTLEALQHIL